jgi:hypothetical protein
LALVSGVMVLTGFSWATFCSTRPPCSLQLYGACCGHAYVDTCVCLLPCVLAVCPLLLAQAVVTLQDPTLKAVGVLSRCWEVVFVVVSMTPAFCASFAAVLQVGLADQVGPLATSDSCNFCTFAHVRPTPSFGMCSSQSDTRTTAAS